MSVVRIAEIVLAALAAVVVYGQIGWMIGKCLTKDESSKDGLIAVTLFWPMVTAVVYVLWPFLKLIGKSIVWPERYLAAKREAAEVARLRTPAPPDPHALPRIAAIDDQIAGLNAERRALMKRPDATRP
jgi:hypothetical protein